MNDLKLAKTYDKCPSGSPRLTVVFLHGIASSSETFNKTIEHLSEKCGDVRYVTFDLLGAGKSPKSDELKYNFKEQLEALDHSIDDLKVETPLILVGHSMGCLISARYADLHKRKVKELVLISPPVYRPEDFNNPVFKAGMDNFEKIITTRNPAMKDDKAFYAELENIVMNPGNYAVYARLTQPTTIIFGLADQIIANFNIPGLLRKNPQISAIETPGTHGITHDKYDKIVKILEKYTK